MSNLEKRNSAVAKQVEEAVKKFGYKPETALDYIAEKLTGIHASTVISLYLEDGVYGEYSFTSGWQKEGKNFVGDSMVQLNWGSFRCHDNGEVMVFMAIECAGLPGAKLDSILEEGLRLFLNQN